MTRQKTTTQVCISIYPNQKEWIRKHHMNMSSLFREFLDDYIRNYEEFFKRKNRE